MQTFSVMPTVVTYSDLHKCLPFAITEGSIGQTLFGIVLQLYFNTKKSKNKGTILDDYAGKTYTYVKAVEFMGKAW